MRLLSTWQHPFLGLSEFPHGLTEFEIRYFFHFDEREREAIQSRRGANLRLAAALHLGFLRMTGCTLDAVDRVPVSVLCAVAESLNLPRVELTTLRALYGRRRSTLFEHQNWAMEVLGIRPFTNRRQRALVRVLRREARTALSLPELALSIKKWLYEKKILIPAERRVRELARRLYRDAEQQLAAEINATVPSNTREFWWDELYQPATVYRTNLEWLQRAPKRRSQTTLDDAINRLTLLRILGIQHYPLPGICLEKQRYYAQSCQRRRPARVRALSEPRRSLELVCFLRITLLQVTDLILSLADLRITDLRRGAQDRVRSQEQRELLEIRRALAVVHTMATDETVSDAEFRTCYLEHFPTPILGNRSRADRFREALTDDHRRVHRLLGQALTPRLECRPDSATHRAIEQRERLQCARALPEGLDVEVPKSWRPLTEGSDRKRALHAFEAATLLSVQKALRNGTLWAPDSLSFRRRNGMLIPEAQWREKRAQYYRSLGLPRSPDTYLQPRLAALKAGIDCVAEAVDRQDITIDHQGIHLSQLSGQDEDRAVVLARKRLFAEIGPVQLAKIIVAIDGEVRFSWNLLGRPARDRRELLALYGALLAHGTDINAAEVSMLMPEISEALIADVMRFLERDNALRAANDLVVAFMRRHPIVRHWGTGQTASADAMSLDVSRQLWNARVDPRRRTYGVGIYSHLLDQWGVIYDQPILLGTRQAGPAIEGAVRQTAVEPLAQLAVDTHGYTDFAMGFARLLGFDLCPRLKALRDRKLHVPVGFTVPDTLSSVVKPDVRLTQFDRYWNELVHVAASVISGHTSAVLVLQRFGSATRGDPIHRAGTALGQLERSLFLCDVLTNTAFRRGLSRLLFHGESYHNLERAIHYGSIKAARGRRPEELIAISGSLTLLANLIMAWNTQQMQRILDQWRSTDQHIGPDIVHHIAPTHFRHINFRGEFHFPIEQAAHRLFANQATAGP